MFDYNYNNIKLNLQGMEDEILELDTRYSTTKKILDHIRIVKESVEELNRRRNTGVRTKGRWETSEDGVTYCSRCQAPKIQTYDNFCGNCGADMGKL